MTISKQERQKLIIAPATRDDVHTILQFINDLAEYEKLSHEVVATTTQLEETLFGERPVAEVLIGSCNSEPVCFALFFHNYSTFLGQPGIYLEDLFVKPQWRGNGFGKAMLQHLAKLAVERKCGRLEWSVLDWNSPAIDFYESLGAVAQKEWVTYRCTGENLNRLARPQDGK